MLRMLKNWKGKIEVNGKLYDNIQLATSDFETFSGDIHIKLHKTMENRYISQPDTIQVNSKEVAKSENRKADIDISKELRITVKAYMTKKATPEFEFMAKFNNDIPMPMRIMEGTIEKQTKGMYYMHLHGLAKPTITCYCCGKELTNPVSRHYGIGPICLGKLGIVREIDDIENIKEELTKIEWSGWVVKSSIIEMEEIE